jgi:transposase InsO family protein
MIDEKARVAIALKKFSLISPIINGQISSIGEYSREITETPIEMPRYGFKKYSPKTISVWYSDYMKGGIDALKPAPRSDQGVSRVLKPEMAEGILLKLKEYPKAPATVIYDMLLDEKIFLKKDVSLATVRRFIKQNKSTAMDEGPKAQMLRFSKGRVNELWMTDIMYGPYVGQKKKNPTYLMAYIDDASRLITGAQFYLTQDLVSLRDSFKDAVLRRGIPKVIYTDNGKIYRSQSFEYLCANLGVMLVRHGVGLAHQKGKIERFFRTVRLRFISILKNNELESIESLNEKFANWLLNDYQKQPHEGISGESPLAFFLKQAEQVELITDMAEFNRKLMITVKRTVKKDATISLNGNLYETELFLAGEKLDIKYDPDTGSIIQELYLYRNDTPVGTARLVNYTENSKRKRKRESGDKRNEKPLVPERGDDVADKNQKTNTISYSDAMGGEKQCLHNTSV